jgi:hypothetical protein
MRKGDVLVVWKLDRLSRSLKDLLLILEKIKGAGADFQSLTEAIDTATPAGRMMMQIVGSFAEFERAMLRERTRTGLEAARQEGRVGGRRPKLSPQQQKGSYRPGAVRPQDRRRRRQVVSGASFDRGAVAGEGRAEGLTKSFRFPSTVEAPCAGKRQSAMQEPGGKPKECAAYCTSCGMCGETSLAGG